MHENVIKIFCHRTTITISVVLQVYNMYPLCHNSSLTWENELLSMIKVWQPGGMTFFFKLLFIYLFFHLFLLVGG